MSEPALLTIRGFAAAARADGTILNTETPARPGDRIRLFGTGFDPDAGVSVMVGGRAAAVAGMSVLGGGLFEIDIAVPSLATGDYPVVASSGSRETQPGVLLRVRSRSPAP